MEQPQRIVGLAVIGLLITWLISLIVGALAAINGGWTGAGLSLIAAALSLGLLLNGLLS